MTNGNHLYTPIFFTLSHRIQGTPDRLMQQLIEEHSQVDPTYVEDFLLTYRTFLTNPQEIASKLLIWFNDPEKRAKVNNIINNYEERKTYWYLLFGSGNLLSLYVLPSQQHTVYMSCLDRGVNSGPFTLMSSKYVI